MLHLPERLAPTGTKCILLIISICTFPMKPSNYSIFIAPSAPFMLSVQYTRHLSSLSLCVSSLPSSDCYKKFKPKASEAFPISRKSCLFGVKTWHLFCWAYASILALRVREAGKLLRLGRMILPSSSTLENTIRMNFHNSACSIASLPCGSFVLKYTFGWIGSSNFPCRRGSLENIADNNLAVC